MRWLYASVLLIASVFLFYSGPQDFPQRSVKALWDLGHVAYFLVFTLILLDFKRIGSLPPLWQWVVGLFLGSVLSGLIEGLQQMVARTASWEDIARNLLGVILALSFSSKSGLRQAKASLSLRVIAVGLLAASMLPFARALVDEIQALGQFPVLADFTHPFELDRWEGDAEFSKEIGDDGDIHLRVRLNTRQYSGIGLAYPARDWHGFDSLNLDLEIPGEVPLTLTLRVHDDFHNNLYSDRFNRSFELKPGLNSLRIDLEEIQGGPITRSMDMGRIANLKLFSISLPSARTLHIRQIYLSKD